MQRSVAENSGGQIVEATARTSSEKRERMNTPEVAEVNSDEPYYWEKELGTWELKGRGLGAGGRDSAEGFISKGEYIPNHDSLCTKVLSIALRKLLELAND